MDAIVADVLVKANALGVWLMKGNAAVAAATRDASVAMPRVYVSAGGEAAVDLTGGDRAMSAGRVTQLLAYPIRGLTIVVVFGNDSSLGLVRLRVRQAQGAIEKELDAGRWF